MNRRTEHGLGTFCTALGCMRSQVLRSDISFSLGDDARLDLVTDVQTATEQISRDFQRGSIKECRCQNSIAVRHEQTQVGAYVRGAGCFSSRGMSGSNTAQLGALEVQMVLLGFPTSGSFNVPARMPITYCRASLCVNRGVPHFGQNCRCMVLPLAAKLV